MIQHSIPSSWSITLASPITPQSLPNHSPITPQSLPNHLPQQLSSIQLRTLNKERSEILAAAYVHDGSILTPGQVSRKETLLLPPALESGCMPMRIRALEEVVHTPEELSQLLQAYRGERYLMSVHGGGVWKRQRTSVNVSLREDAEADDIMQAVLQVGRWCGDGACGRWCIILTHTQIYVVCMCRVTQAAYVRRAAGGQQGVATQAVIDSARVQAKREVRTLLKRLEASGWQTSTFSLSGAERIGWSTT